MLHEMRSDRRRATWTERDGRWRVDGDGRGLSPVASPAAPAAWENDDLRGTLHARGETFADKITFPLRGARDIPKPLRYVLQTKASAAY